MRASLPQTLLAVVCVYTLNTQSNERMRRYQKTSRLCLTCYNVYNGKKRSSYLKTRKHLYPNKYMYIPENIYFECEGFQSRHKFVVCIFNTHCKQSVWMYVNDPSAGSPTETLLRLLLPLNDQVWSSSQRHRRCRNAAAYQSEDLTKSFNR